MTKFRDGDGPGSYFQRQFEEDEEERRERFRRARERAMAPRKDPKHPMFRKSQLRLVRQRREAL